MTAEARFNDAVRAIVARGDYPTPKAIRTALGRRVGYRTAGGDYLNGRETRWREAVLTELGWRQTGDYGSCRARPRRSWYRPTIRGRVAIRVASDHLYVYPTPRDWAFFTSDELWPIDTLVHVATLGGD